MDRHAMIDQLVEKRLDARLAAGEAIRNPDAIRTFISGDLTAKTDRELATELGLVKTDHGKAYSVTTLDRAVGLAEIILERGFGVDEASRLVTEEHGPAIAGQAVAIALDRTEQGAA